MKSFVFCLLSFVLGFAASAQQTQPRRTPFANRNLQRPATSQASRRSQTSRASQPSQASQASASANADAAGGRSIEFNATPLDLVLEVYQNLIGKTVLKDPQTPSPTITLKPKERQELTDEDKIEAIETVLEMNGIHIEPYGEKFVRALPRKSVRKEGIPLVLEDAKFDNLEKVVSTIISFKVISVDVGEKILKEFLSEKSGPLQVFKHTNSILVTDTMQNINRMREIMKEIDRKLPPTKVAGEWFVYVLKYATADNVEKALQAAYDYDKKRVEEMNKALETPEKATSTGAGGAPQSARPRPLLGGLVKAAAAQAATKPADSVVAGSSPYVVGMLPTMPLFIYDAENSPDRLIVYTTREEKEKVYDKIVEQLDVPAIPDKVVKVYRLKYAEAEDVSDMINDLINKAAGTRSKNDGKKTSGTAGKPAQQQQAQAASRQQGDGKVGELTPDNTQVLADKRINGLVVQTLRTLVPTVEQIIESMDIKLSQVLIEMCIIEVTLGDGIETGMDWIQKGRSNTAQMSNGLGQKLYYTKRTDSQGNVSWLNETHPEGWTETRYDDEGTVEYVADMMAPAMGALNRNPLFGNNWYGATRTVMGGGAGGGADALAAAAGGAVSNVFGKAFNFIFDSDELGLSAILHAQKDDTRSKYIASPVVMTLDNKEAVVNATRMRYLLKGFTSSGNSYSTIAVPDYEQKELGIELKVTPKINPNGTVMLTVEEKYTELSGSQMIQYSTGTGGDSGLKSVPADLTMTREMSADVLLENNQTVVFGGLTETSTSESESGIPILKDIPIIGKWLFGSVKQDESRVELLVFMTPYVLDDAQAAQVEALRRKKTLSDPRPWDDHGWSLSPIADPVSKQEQLRRIKDQWKIQDEERRTKIAIEKAKVERVKQLEKMSKEERELWLKMHKEELDAEKQDELEEKMLDKDSQEELKKLAAQIKAKKLGEAEKELKAAAEEAAGTNERGRVDAEKKEAEKGSGIGDRGSEQEKGDAK